MKRLLQFVVGLVLALGICAAHAGDVDLVRATCTPDGLLFRIEHHLIDSSGIDHDNAREERRLTRLWEKQGYHRVDRFRQDCPLLRVGYQVRIDREPYKPDGQCSQKPRVNLTLLSNGQPILKDVPYGDDCYSNVAITSLEIREAYDGGAPEMTLCLAYPYDTPKCLPIGPDYMRIGTRSPDGMRHVHPPLDRYGIDSLFKQVD